MPTDSPTLSDPIVGEQPADQRAATLVATYETRRGARVILTRRPDTLRRHPGQISFPGGMIEPSDPSPLAAAIREAQEEVGLFLPLDTPAIPLAPVTTLSSGIVILPFWVRLPRSPRLRATPEEVAAILRVPLVDLRRPGILQPIPHPRRPNESTRAYVWHGQVIWGATAQMLDELLSIFFHASGNSITRPSSADR
ncbi:MAG TPA: CoA pyrophosphatase [Chloroflexota bacterium]|nr:CoA pyrophosphatase [Chloroflexota bacterium]